MAVTMTCLWDKILVLSRTLTVAVRRTCLWDKILLPSRRTPTVAMRRACLWDKILLPSRTMTVPVRTTVRQDRDWKLTPLQVSHLKPAWVPVQKEQEFPSTEETNKKPGCVKKWSQTHSGTEHTHTHILQQGTDIHVVTSVGGALRAWSSRRKQPRLWHWRGGRLSWPRPLSHRLGHRDVPQQVGSALDQVIQRLLHRGVVEVDERGRRGRPLHSTHRRWGRHRKESTLGGNPKHGIHGQRVQWRSPKKSASWQRCQGRLLRCLRLWRGRRRPGRGQGWH